MKIVSVSLLALVCVLSMATVMGQFGAGGGGGFGWCKYWLQSAVYLSIKVHLSGEVLRGRVVNASRFEITRPSPLGVESHER